MKRKTHQVSWTTIECNEKTKTFSVVADFETATALYEALAFANNPKRLKGSVFVPAKITLFPLIFSMPVTKRAKRAK